MSDHLVRGVSRGVLGLFFENQYGHDSKKYPKKSEPPPQKKSWICPCL